MRRINKIILVLTILFAVFSCEKEMGPMVPENAVSPVISAPSSGTSYVLNRSNANEPLVTFAWSEADFKVDVVSKYELQIVAADAEFTNASVLASTFGTSHDFTVGKFNQAVLDAGFEAEKEHQIKVRVVASKYLTSEPITLTVKPYFDVDKWTIIGSAVGGWNVENDQIMTYKPEKETYMITVEMKPGKFKFRAPEKDEDPWKHNFGLEGDSEVVDNGTALELKGGGANIKVTGGNYTIELNVKSKSFTITQNSASDFTNWTDVVLDAVGTGVSIDNANATADPSAWGWGNVLLPDNEGKPSIDGAVYTWKWSNIILEANEGFKLRTLNGEAAPQNDISFDVDFGAIDMENSSSNVVDDGGNITVNAKGKYEIVLTIDATQGDKKIVTINEVKEFPEQLFMTGGAINGLGDATGWNWEENGVEMIPVHSHPDLFWAIVWLSNESGFKIAPEKAWGKDFGIDKNVEPTDGVYDRGGDNIPAPATEGYYTLVYNASTKKIEVNATKVYGIGDTFGGWDAAKDEYKFILDSENKTMVYDGTVKSGDLRMHVAAALLQNDWWQAEFNIMDGKIVFRGTGGDFSGQPATAPGNAVITLDFINGTGSVSQ